MALADVAPARDEVDDVLDDLFGAPDDRGPGAVDAVLLIGGVGAVVGAQVASLPSVVTIVGVTAACLGAVLPARALVRRVTGAQRARRVTALIGDGVLLRSDARSVVALLDAQQTLLSAGGSLDEANRLHVADVAHAAVWEVATLLGGRPPSIAAEVAYVEARTAALLRLADVVSDPRVGDGDHDRRRALVEARREVDAIGGGSSVDDADGLARTLLGHDGS